VVLAFTRKHFLCAGALLHSVSDGAARAGGFGTGTSPVCGAGAFGTGTNTEFSIPGGAATGNSTDCCAGTGYGAGGLSTVAVVGAPAMLVLAAMGCGAGSGTYIL
jgi:hypothetical protein